MCTDLRLVRLPGMHVSARTLDFAVEIDSQVRVVPRGQQWSALPTGTSVEAVTWTNALGFVALDAFGFPDKYADGLNEAGLSVGTLWLAETSMPTTPPTSGTAPAMDFVDLAGWLLGTCSNVEDVRKALASVQVWNAPVKDMWPQEGPVPPALEPLMGWSPTEHLAIHDAHGGDIVVEFLDGIAHIHDNPLGVLTNSPTFDWHITNLRNYVGLSNVNADPVTLMGLTIAPTGNGTGLLGMPGDVTPPSRFVRAVVLSEVTTSASDARAAVNQAFHSLDLVSVPRHVVAAGDYTQWSVVRDHDNLILYVRSYDGWTTDTHDLRALGVDKPGVPATLPLPTA